MAEFDDNSIFCEAIYTHLKKCERCQSVVMSFLAAKAGKVKSNAKRKASAANGKLGGRPKKVVNISDESTDGKTNQPE